MTCRLAANEGHRMWSSTRDGEGNREYRIVFRVESDDPLDGPAVVRQTPGLFITGSSWAWDNDSDPWAFCLPIDSIKQVEEGELVWDVEQVFSSKPLPPGQQRCNDQQIEDPLMEPPKISGGSTKYSEEAPYDRFGQPICSSSWEPIRGQVNEWDANRSSIRIEVNVMSFAQVMIALSMRDCVNMFPIWGYAARCVKLSNVNWERKYYGLCYAYYTVVMDFDTNSLTFDRDIMDEGHKCLKGHWDGATGQFYLDDIGEGANRRSPHPQNPSDFIRIPDREGNPTRMVLNGYGLPACTVVRVRLSDAQPAEYGLTLQKYIYYSNEADDGILQPPMSRLKWMAHVPSLVNIGDNFLTSVWEPDRGYVAGELVYDNFSSELFLCIAGNINDHPAISSGNWVSMDSLTNRGAWVSGTTNYFYGDYVVMSTTTDPVGTGYYTFTTTIGRRHVEKYNEANFLSLGLPLFF